jgi:excinuclease Cho
MTINSGSEEFKHRIDLASLAALPHTTGVYVFHGSGSLPLYIGKSLDIRSRVLAHLRAPDEAKMIAQTRHIEFIETAGEIGALLLESQMIKSNSPLYNIRLRRSRDLCTIGLTRRPEGLIPQVVSCRELDLGRENGLFGLFSSRHAAIGKLRELAAENHLCLALLGVEKISKRGCFGVQIKTCRGACIGLEPRAAHDERLYTALTGYQVHAWPFSGEISLIERNGDWVQKHRLQDWRYLGTWCSKNKIPTQFMQEGFDLDTYKILVKPIMLGLVELESTA